MGYKHEHNHNHEQDNCKECADCSEDINLIKDCGKKCCNTEDIKRLNKLFGKLDSELQQHIIDNLDVIHEGNDISLLTNDAGYITCGSLINCLLIQDIQDTISNIVSGDIKWGNIQGLLSDQTDLQNALDNKFDNNNKTITTNDNIYNVGEISSVNEKDAYIGNIASLNNGYKGLITELIGWENLDLSSEKINIINKIKNIYNVI